ncbi:MAG: hypothetical protein P4K78_10715 [Terracidiphilus sp.]|nr:hypothetical protein [Terracidiphilus sp.]
MSADEIVKLGIKALKFSVASYLCAKYANPWWDKLLGSYLP